jgi:FixJ family two-component response regulator
MTEPTPVVFLVDDDEAVRKGLSRLLRTVGFRVETFASAAEFLARKAHDGIGCIILDVNMPGLSGLDLQAQLAGVGNDLPIVFLTGYGDIPMAVRAMKHGAIEFLTKPVDETLLLSAVQHALSVHDAEQAERRALEATRERLATLTPREREVMCCIISGAMNKQIAGHLGIAEKTVKVHRGRVMEKTGAGSVAELVRLCELVGVEPECIVHPRVSVPDSP